MSITQNRPNLVQMEASALARASQMLTQQQRISAQGRYSPEQNLRERSSSYSDMQFRQSAAVGKAAIRGAAMSSPQR